MSVITHFDFRIVYRYFFLARPHAAPPRPTGFEDRVSLAYRFARSLATTHMVSDGQAGPRGTNGPDPPPPPSLGRFDHLRLDVARNPDADYTSCKTPFFNPPPKCGRNHRLFSLDGASAHQDSCYLHPDPRPFQRTVIPWVVGQPPSLPHPRLTQSYTTRQWR